MAIDIQKLLETWPLWRRISELPKETDDLKERIASLEQKLGGKWPPDVCQFCGERASRMTATVGPTAKGQIRQDWTCGACSRVDVRLVR
jgi:hypothetical protein